MKTRNRKMRALITHKIRNYQALLKGNAIRALFSSLPPPPSTPSRAQIQTTQQNTAGKQLSLEVTLMSPLLRNRQLPSEELPERATIIVKPLGEVRRRVRIPSLRNRATKRHWRTSWVPARLSILLSLILSMKSRRVTCANTQVRPSNRIRHRSIVRPEITASSRMTKNYCFYTRTAF